MDLNRLKRSPAFIGIGLTVALYFCISFLRACGGSRFSGEWAQNLLMTACIASVFLSSLLLGRRLKFGGGHASLVRRLSDLVGAFGLTYLYAITFTVQRMPDFIEGFEILGFVSAITIGVSAFCAKAPAAFEDRRRALEAS